MPIGLFTDKTHPPTSEEILAAVGPRQPAWQDLGQLVGERYAAHEEFSLYPDRSR
jgi:hypothetical protein